MDSKSTTDTVYTPENEEAVRDFSSPIWQKTAIAVLAENNATNKKHNKEAASDSTKGEEVGTYSTQNSNVDVLQEIIMIQKALTLV